MDVLQFLPHDVRILNLLRMTPFLPKLVFLVDLVPQFEAAQFIEHCLVARAGQFVENAPRGKRLESAKLLAQFVVSGDPVQMIFHHDVAEDFHVPLALQESPGVEDDFSESWMGKNLQQGHDRAGKELRVLGFKDLVSTARH